MRISVIFLLLWLFLAKGSEACQCKEMDEKILFSKASAVFLGEITSTALVKMPFILNPKEIVDVIEAKFDVIEIFKGEPKNLDAVRDLSFSFGNCSIGLMSGMEYVFFVTENDLGLKNYVGMCTGSKPVNVGATNFKDILNELRSLGQKK